MPVCAPTRRGISLPDAPPTGVLITRPAEGAGATARRVMELGFTPIAAPLLAIRTLPARLPPAASLQAVLVTSANALTALPASLRDVALFAVGDATAQRARSTGFRTVHSAAGDAVALAALVRATCDPGRGTLLLAGARGQGRSLAAALREAGFTVLRRAVYAAVPVTTLPASATAALAAGMVTVAMFFSPATSRAFATLLPAALPTSHQAPVTALAISSAAVLPLAPLPWRRIRVASRPNQDALLDLLCDETS